MIIVICTGSVSEWNVSLGQHRYTIRGWNFKSSSGWCVQLMWRNSVSLQWRTPLCKKLKILHFGIGDEIPVYFDIPFMMQVQNLSTKATGSEDIWVTNVDRQDKATTVWIWIKRSVSKAQLLVRLTVVHLTKE
jgi:hypothetical protein